MFCIKCGAQIPVDAKYCHSCGKQLRDEYTTSGSFFLDDKAELIDEDNIDIVLSRLKNASYNDNCNYIIITLKYGLTIEELKKYCGKYYMNHVDKTRTSNALFLVMDIISNKTLVDGRYNSAEKNNILNKVDVVFDIIANDVNAHRWGVVIDRFLSKCEELSYRLSSDSKLKKDKKEQSLFDKILNFFVNMSRKMRIIAIIVFSVVVLSIVACSLQSKDKYAIECAESLVMEQLKSPQSAIFSNAVIEDKDKYGRYVVSFVCDADNSFGASVRNYYVVCVWDVSSKSYRHNAMSVQRYEYSSNKDHIISLVKEYCDFDEPMEKK